MMPLILRNKRQKTKILAAIPNNDPDIHADALSNSNSLVGPRLPLRCPGLLGTRHARAALRVLLRRGVDDGRDARPGQLQVLRRSSSSGGGADADAAADSLVV